VTTDSVTSLQTLVSRLQIGLDSRERYLGSVSFDITVWQYFFCDTFPDIHFILLKTIQQQLSTCSAVRKCQTEFSVHYRVITARCYASAVLVMGLCPSVCVCLSVCLSVTSRCSTKTAKRRITQTTPHDTPGTLVF